jgi:hypothetical protein
LLNCFCLVPGALSRSLCGGKSKLSPLGPDPSQQEFPHFSQTSIVRPTAMWEAAQQRASESTTIKHPFLGKLLFTMISPMGFPCYTSCRIGFHPPLFALSSDKLTSCPHPCFPSVGVGLFPCNRPSRRVTAWHKDCISLTPTGYAMNIVYTGRKNYRSTTLFSCQSSASRSGSEEVRFLSCGTRARMNIFSAD